MSAKLDPRIIGGFALALAVLLLSTGAALLSIRELGVQTRRVEHTYQVLGQVENIVSVLKDAQTGVRGFVLTGDTVYLRPYYQASALMPDALAQVSQLTADNADQQQRLDSLAQLVEQEFRTMRPLTVPQAAMSRSAMQTSLDTDRQTMQLVRRLYGRITTQEMGLLTQRNQRQEFYARTTPAFVVVAAVLALAIVGWLFAKIVRELTANRRLQAELSQTNADTARRIEVIEDLARQVVAGDFSVKIPAAEKDRLGSLATSLNRMTASLDEAFGRLAKRNQELDQFAYVASHDLKAPLRGVATIVKWIDDELAAEISPQLRAYLDQMKGRLARLEDLINGLLAYARAGRTERRVETVDTAALLRDVAELVVPPDFQLELAPGLPTFATDRLSLEQVFTNLLSNAVKYHDRGAGHIRVGARDVGRHYEFRVADDGPGIAPEHHQKIFLLFQTLRDRHTAESTGIGLSIVKKIIDEQQGTVRVESAPGQGAAFVFTWPK